MDVDDRIRPLLRDAMAPLDDVAGARREVDRRSIGVRRRRRGWRVSVAAAATAAAVVGVVLWTTQPGVDRPPVIGPVPDASPDPSPAEGGAVGPACQDLSVSEDLGSFLDRWTAAGTSLLDDACVLPGRVGPVPRFDTDDLGRQQALLPGALPEGFELAPTGPMRARVEGYPLVHIGRVEGTDAQTFLEWRLNDTPAPVACVEGSCGQDALPAGTPGVLGIGGGSGATGSIRVFDVWVAPEASVVALAIDGEPLLWQRPVALTSRLLVEDYRPTPDATYEIRVFDGQGRRIASHEGTVDPS